MNLMDEIAQQLLSGLPDGWRPFTQLTKLPPQTRLVLSASSAAHRLVFLLVYGQVRTATPIFEVNAQLRKSGCEVVWLFDECAIPSTKHMVCSVVAKSSDGEIQAAIVNSTDGGISTSGSISLPALAKAAAEHRLKVQGFKSGQRVAVRMDSRKSPCSTCGNWVYELQRATIQPSGDPCAPGLELPKEHIGRCIAAMIAGAVDSESGIQYAIGGAGRTCKVCTGAHRVGLFRFQQMPAFIDGISLTSSAAYELVKRNRTHWYIA